MVDFTCSHCNTHFSVADDLAGRQGWCRSCKRMIIVPMPDGSGGFQDLGIEERCRRLDRLVQYAATKADRYRLMLYQIQQENEKLSLRVGVADEHAMRLHSAEERLAEAQGAMEGLVRELERGAAAREQLYEQNEELHRQCAHLLSELAEEKAARANADKRLSDARRLRREDRRRAEDDLAVLRDQLARTEAAASDNGDWEVVLRERDHLRGALDAAQQQRCDAEQRLAQAVADLHRREQPADGGAEELHDKLHALEQQLAEAEAAWETSEKQRLDAEEAAVLRDQELRGLRDAERNHKSLARKLDALEQELRQAQESLAAAEHAATEAVEQWAAAEAAAQASNEEAVRLKEALRIAEQMKEAALFAKAAAEQAAAARLADVGETSLEEDETVSEDEGGGKKSAWRWLGRTDKVELVPLGESLGDGDVDIILTPELLGDDPLTDNFMSFLDAETEEDGDEMRRSD